MKILSLFDGLGGARIALNNLGIPIEKYFSSEIDKKCITILKKNYPDSICLGDVKNIVSSDLGEIDLLIGGSPCQNLSISGDRKGLEGEKSSLFYEYYRLFNDLHPKYFLLENVFGMGPESKKLISDLLKCDPVEINSIDFTPQRRKRYYWTNLKIDKIVPKKIYVRDILNFEANKEKQCSDKPNHMLSINYGGQGDRVYSIYAKGICLSAATGGAGSRTGMYLMDSTGEISDSLKNQPKIFLKPFEDPAYKYSYKGIQARKLTALEAERMQGIPDDYTLGVPNTSREQMIGNGFTIPVIEHILKGINHEKV